jgi:uncharacterized protein (DUF983 family)
MALVIICIICELGRLCVPLLHTNARTNRCATQLFFENFDNLPATGPVTIWIVAAGHGAVSFLAAEKQG